MPKMGHTNWTVPFAAGTLMAVGYKGGKVFCNASVTTAAAADRIKLTLVTPTNGILLRDGQDSALVSVGVVDSHGVPVPDASHHIRFSTSSSQGAAVVGVANGDPANHEPTRGTAIAAFHGRAAAVIRVGGPKGADAAAAVTVTASAAGLGSGDVTLQLQPTQTAAPTRLLTDDDDASMPLTTMPAHDGRVQRDNDDGGVEPSRQQRRAVERHGRRGYNLLASVVLVTGERTAAAADGNHTAHARLDLDQRPPAAGKPCGSQPHACRQEPAAAAVGAQGGARGARKGLPAAALRLQAKREHGRARRRGENCEDGALGALPVRNRERRRAGAGVDTER